MKFRKSLGACGALSLALFAANFSRADEGPWEVALQGVYSAAANRSSAIPLLGVPTDDIHTSDSWRAVINAQYFVVPRVAVELALTYPQSQSLRVTRSAYGADAAGDFKDLPVILTAKYSFITSGLIQPYLGVGINWTHFSSADLAIPNGPLELNTWSVGPAVQAGADVKLASHWYANLDIKWSKVGSDVDLCCVRVSAVHMDPLSIGLGVGYRFGGAP